MNKSKIMKRNSLTIIFLVLVISLPGLAQNKPDYSKIDIMLILGDFKRVIDTCSQILAVDTLNSDCLLPDSHFYAEREI